MRQSSPAAVDLLLWISEALQELGNALGGGPGLVLGRIFMLRVLIVGK